MPEITADHEKKSTPREAYNGPRLLYSRYEICGLLHIGLTLCDELMADGTIEVVRLGRRKMGTAESVHRVAKTETP